MHQRDREKKPARFDMLDAEQRNKERLLHTAKPAGCTLLISLESRLTAIAPPSFPAEKTGSGLENRRRGAECARALGSFGSLVDFIYPGLLHARGDSWRPLQCNAPPGWLTSVFHWV